MKLAPKENKRYSITIIAESVAAGSVLGELLQPICNVRDSNHSDNRC